MNTTTNDVRPGRGRRRHLVDRQIQLSITLPLLGALWLIAGLYAAAVFVLPGTDAVAQLPSDEIRKLLLLTHLVYFAIGTAIVATLAILLTHRIAGPALVIERAIKAMAEGDHGQRLTLRKRDCLKSLAASVLRLSTHIQSKDAERAQIIKDLDRCLQERDVKAARELLARMGAAGPKAAEPQAAAA
ncbi:MAG: hypothetical protein ACREID_05070, partial [Planctomycetota bacterium]